MENWRNIIPVGFFLPFLIILVLEYIGGYALDYYNQKLSHQIDTLRTSVKEKETKLAGTLETDPTYRAFSRAVDLVEILNQRKSVVYVINKFNQLMPRSLVIKDFFYDSDNNTIQISGLVSNWIEYSRFLKYVNNLKDLEVKSYSYGTLNEDNSISFSMVFSLKPSFFQK